MAKKEVSKVAKSAGALSLKKLTPMIASAVVTQYKHRSNTGHTRPEHAGHTLVNTVSNQVKCWSSAFFGQTSVVIHVQQRSDMSVL
jgi:hypothetical protein